MIRIEITRQSENRKITNTNNRGSTLF